MFVLQLRKQALIHHHFNTAKAVNQSSHGKELVVCWSQQGSMIELYNANYVNMFRMNVLSYCGGLFLLITIINLLIFFVVFF